MFRSSHLHRVSHVAAAATMDDDQKAKAHRARHSGRKADKKEKKNEHVQELTAKQRNPKAFSVQSVQKAEKKIQKG